MSGPLPWSTAWVTGASTGIGRGLVERLAKGGTKVAASARSADKLAALADEHSQVLPMPFDVRDLAATKEAAGNVIQRLGVPDLVVLNAGIGRFKSASRFDAEHFRDAVETNVIGMGNVLGSMVPEMVERGSGHIALMGSLAGYRGFPKAGHYAPSKAAIRSLADCLRFDLERKGLTISIINPGYVETPLTEGFEDHPMPGLMALDPALDIIMSGLAARKFEIAFPRRMALLVKLGTRVSNFTYFRITRWTMGID